MAKKKNTYKVPSIVALTLAGTALTTHHAQAASNTQDQTPNKNVLDDEKALNQSEQIKSEISKPTTNISGTQTYQDPTEVKDASENEEKNYDAQLDELNNQSSEQTSKQDTYNLEAPVQEEQQDVSQDNASESTKIVQTSTEHDNQEVQEETTETPQTNTSNEEQDTSSEVQPSHDDNLNVEEHNTEASNTNENPSVNTTENVDSSNDDQDNVQSDDSTASESAKQDDTSNLDDASDADNEDVNASNIDQDKAQSDDTAASESVKQDDASGQYDASDADNEDIDVSKDDQDNAQSNDSAASESAKQDDTSNLDDASDADNEDVNASNIDQDKAQSDDTAASESAKQDDASSLDDASDADNEDIDVSKDDQDNAQSNDSAASESAKQDDASSQDDASNADNEDIDASNNDQDKAQSDDTAASESAKQDDASSLDDASDADNEDIDASNDDQDNAQSDDTAASESAKQDDASSLDDASDADNEDIDVSKNDQNGKEPATKVANNVAKSTEKASPEEKKVQLTTFSTKATPKLRVANTSANTAVASRSAVTRAATTSAALPKYSPKVNSSINNYIRKNNFKAPNYEQDIASYLPKYNYRYGKPEGIVMHDTANDSSTITGEINYMKNNYTSAFVHAYVDGNRIIETANTDYLAWGAGPQANDRFIHVELVHTHDYDSFARSINNYADYAATNLQYYGLAPDSAEYDGVGTVWTHQAVSNYLGGSDHSDPHGYLAAHNYSYDELYDLIYEKYLIKTGKAAAWGSTSSGSTGGTGSGNTGTTTPPKTGTVKVTENNGVGRINSKNDGLYTTVYDQNGKKTDRINQTLKVTKSATLGKENYYLVSDYNKGTLLGWVHQGDVSYNAAKAATKINKTYKVNPGEVIYSVPWGTSSQKVGTVSGKSAQTFKATKQQQIGKTNYIYGTVNNLSGWVSLSKLSTSTTTPSKPSTTDKLVVSNLTNQQGTVAKSNHGVYTSVYDKQGTQKSYVNGQTYKLSKKATLGSNAFYLITDNKTNTNLGWMQSRDITVKEAAKKPVANQTQTVSKIGQLNANNSGIKTTVYDPKGKDASKFSGKTYTVTKQRTQGDNTYVLIQNANQNTPIGWINTKDINTRNLGNTTAKNGQYTVKATNNGLYAVPWGTKSQQLDTLKNVKNNQFNASKSVFVDKDEYVYGIVNNKTGWIAAKDLNNTTKAPTVSKSPVTPIKFDYVIHNQKGNYYNDPTTNKPAGSLKDFYEGIFTVYEKQVINGVTWYHGKLANGKVVWVKEDDLRKELVKYYQSGLTLDQAVAIQKGLKFKPQIQHTAGKWENASASEIKNAMDSSKLIKDPTQKYQFLRLDKSQNISSADLNKLLVGKGILEGQGEAFSEAAKAYNINEVYLISHALLETGNGTSKLANGGDVVNGKVVTNGTDKYYNMFGIGAVDSDAVKQGFITAKNNGWNTVKKAIVGGAKFIAGSYINQGQNTLYKMRWNPENPGVHQYATDVAWASHNATRIKGFYDSMGKLGKYFDVDTYKK